MLQSVTPMSGIAYVSGRSCNKKFKVTGQRVNLL